jgi:hypothetical protein
MKRPTLPPSLGAADLSYPAEINGRGERLDAGYDYFIQRNARLRKLGVDLTLRFRESGPPFTTIRDPLTGGLLEHPGQLAAESLPADVLRFLGRERTER